MKRNVLAQLENVHALVASTLTVCQNSKKSKELKEVLATAKTEVSNALASIAESNKRRRLSQTKKTLVVLDNTFSGLLEGLNSRELSVTDFRAVCANLQTKFIPNFETSLSTESERIRSRAQGGANADVVTLQDENLTESQNAVRAVLSAEADQHVAAATKDLENTPTVTSAEVHDDEDEEDDDSETEDEREERIQRERERRDDEEVDVVERRLKRLGKTREVLPTKLKTPYTLMRLPVVPIFETANATYPPLLEKLAIPHTEIPLPLSASQGRYVIFEQQVLLLISRKAVNDMIEKQKAMRIENVKGNVKDKKDDLKTILANIQTTQTALEKARKKLAASNVQAIRALEAKIDAGQRALDTKFRNGRTKEERELYLEIVRADKTDPNTQKAGFLRAARHDHSEAEEAQKKLPIDKRTGIPAKIQTRLEKAEAKYADMQKQLETMRMARADKGDKAKMLELRELRKEMRILQRKEDKRIGPVRDLEQQLTRLNDRYETETQRIADLKKSSKRAPSMTSEDYARSVLAIINERGDINYSLVTSISAPNPRNADILCFWLMPNGKLSGLLKATGGKAKVKSWSFPAYEKQAGVELKSLNERANKWVHPSRDPKHEDFLEFDQNKHLRPDGWKTRMKKPPKPMQ